MSRSIDSRVVEMRFNNSQFESGVKQSLNTLQRLKAALKNLATPNKAADLLGSAAKNSKSSIDQIAQGVSSLEKRFSFLGETARMAANKVRDSLVGTVGKAINAVKEGIVTGGIRRATNIENAHYQLQTLLKDEEKVQKVMDNAMESVDGTAYGFDEAAKAASMFAASGIKSGKSMTNALKGIAGTAAMTNAEYERISMIFTTVAGQGRLMGDQLLQLSSLGLNAPASIATFFNEIGDGTAKASKKVKKAVEEITGGAKVTEKDIRELVTGGKISFQIFAEAMYSAFGESAARANETFNGSLSNIKAALSRIGAEFVSPLIAQNSKVVKLFNTLRERINDIKKALVFDKEIGNMNAYSKRFTDSVLGMAKSLNQWLKTLDVAKGMKVFYNVVDSVINIFKTLWSIVEPLGKAFSDVFLNFDVKDIIKVTKEIKKFTEGLILSKKESKNLQDAFKGVFSVIKLLVDGFVGLLSAILNVDIPIGSLSKGLLDLIGSIGRGLTAFTEWVRESKLVKMAFEGISSVAKIVGNAINGLVDNVKNFVSKAVEMKVIEKTISVILQSFKALGEFAAPYIETVVNKLKEFVNVVKEWAGSALSTVGDKLQSMFEKIWDVLSNFKMDDVTKKTNEFSSSFKNMTDTFGDNFKGFVNNLKTFGERLKEAFNFSKIVDNILSFKNLVQEFVEWFKEVFGKVLGEASFGGLFAGAGGLGIIYSIIKISQTLEKGLEGLSALSKLLESVSGTLKAWQSQIKAETLKKTAEAILILAGALVVLSFTDTDKAFEASVSLSIIAGVLLAGMTKFMQALGQSRNFASHIDYFAKYAGKSLNNLAKSVKWKAIGETFKDFGKAIIMVAGSLIVVGLMYRKDKEALQEAEKLVAVVAAVIVGIIGAMVTIESKLSISGTGVLKIALSVISLTGAISLIVGSLKKIMNLKFPEDYAVRLGILAGMLAELALVSIALGTASRIAAGNKIQSGPIIAVAIALKICVSSLNDVFKIKIPSDWGVKFGILTVLFIELGGLIAAIGGAQRLAGGAMKGMGVLLALAADIAVITASLMVLSIIPVEGMEKGAKALGMVLLVLAADLYATSKIATSDTAKTVLNMAIMVGAIAASLGVLSIIPIPNLAVACAALGSMLLALAVDFAAISKISNNSVWQPIVAMVGVIVSITASLFVLAQQPWDRMLASGVAMSATLLAFAEAFAIIGRSQNVNLGKAATFLAFSLAVIPIGAALTTLSSQPWQGMLAAAASMSGVLLAFSAAFTIISKSNVKLSTVVGFVAASVALIPIAAALDMLAGQSWASILPGATSLGIVVTAIGAAMGIMGKAGTKALVGVAAFVGGALAIIPITAALDMLAGESWSSILPGATALSAVSIALAAAMSIMGGVGARVLVGVVGFVAAAVALIPVGNVIKQLSGLSWEEVARGLTALAGGLVVIAGAAIVGGSIAPGLIAIGAAMVVFGAGLAAVGAALPVFVNGLSVAIQALSAFISDLGGAISGMVDAGKNLMLGLAGGIVSGVQAVVGVVGDVASGIVDTVKGLLGIHSPSTVFEEMGLNVDEGFAQGILGGEGSVNDAIDSVFNGISDEVDVESLFPKGEEGAGLFGDGLLSGEGNIDSIMKNITDATGIDVSSFMNVGKKGADSLGKGISSGKGNVKKVMKELADATGTDISSFDKLGKNASNKYGFGLKSGDGNVKKTIKAMADATQTDINSYTNLGKKAADNFSKGVKSGAKSGANGTASNVAKTLKDAISSAVKGTNYADSGKKISTALSNGIKESQPKIKTTIDELMKSASNAIKQKNETFKSSGSKTITSYVNGLKSKSSNATDSIKKLVNKMGDEIKSSNKDFNKKGQDTISNLVKGIKSKQGDATKIVKNLANNMVKQLQNNAKNFQAPGRDSAAQYTKAMKSALESGMSNIISSMATKGKQLVQGLANGINANSGIARNAASQLARQVDNQIKSDLGIHSPSKVAEERGKQVVEGFMEGIKKYTPMAKLAVGDLTKSVKGSFEHGSKQVVEGFAQGIKKYTPMAKSALNGFTHSVNSEFENSGKQFVEKLVRGIKKYTPMAETAVNDLSYLAKGSFEHGGKQAVEGFAQGLKKNTKLAILATYGFTHSIKGSLEIGIDQLKKETTNHLTDDYLSNTIVDTIKNMKKTMEKELEGLSGFAKAWYKREASYRYQIETEEDYWKKLLQIKQSGVDKEKYLEMDLDTFRNEMLDSYQSIMDDYQDQIAQEQQNIFSQIDIFSEVNKSLLKTRQQQADADYKAAKKEEAATKQREKNGKTEKETTEAKREIVKTLKELSSENTKALASYEKNLRKAQERLKGTSLWDFLIDQGISSLPTLKEINKMSDDELKATIKNFDNSLDIALSIAKLKMGDVTAETKKQLDEMFAIGKEDLDQITIQREERLSIEDQYWTKLLETKKAGAEQEKYLEMDLKTFREGVLEETTKIVEDYQKQFESTRQNIMSEMDIFTEISEKQVKTKDELYTTLGDQVLAYEEYLSVMDSLSKRLEGTNLIGYLKELGVGSLEQLKEINSMTDEELETYSRLYDRKLEYAGDIANQRLKTIKTETEAELQELFGAATDIDIDDFTSKFDGTLESLESFLLSLTNSIGDTTNTLSTSFKEIVTQMNETLNGGLSSLFDSLHKGFSGIDKELVEGITSASEPVATAASSMVAAAIKKITGKSDKFSDAGENSGTYYSKGLDKTKNEAKNSGSTLAGKAISGMVGKEKAFTNEGNKEGGNYNTGVKSQYGNAKITGTELANETLNGIKSQYSNAKQTGTGLSNEALTAMISKSGDFHQIGSESGSNFSDGLESQTGSVKRVSSNMASAAINKFDRLPNDLYYVGRNAGAGLADGLDSKYYDVKAAADRLAEAAKAATEAALKVHSPSKVMMEIGGYTGEGFVLGILGCLSKVAAASDALGETAQNGTKGYLGNLSDVISDDFDFNPVITPEVDLSNVTHSVNDISKMFNDAIRIASADVEVIDAGIKFQNSRINNERERSNIRNKGEDGGNTYNFTQNNYSPKALSRSDIYRQTRNQFSLFATKVGRA